MMAWLDTIFLFVWCYSFYYWILFIYILFPSSDRTWIHLLVHLSTSRVISHQGTLFFFPFFHKGSHLYLDDKSASVWSSSRQTKWSWWSSDQIPSGEMKHQFNMRWKYQLDSRTYNSLSHFWKDHFVCWNFHLLLSPIFICISIIHSSSHIVSPSFPSCVSLSSWCYITWSCQSEVVDPSLFDFCLNNTHLVLPGSRDEGWRCWRWLWWSNKRRKEGKWKVEWDKSGAILVEPGSKHGHHFVFSSSWSFISISPS